MKSTDMKSTHTDLTSGNICLFDLRLMIVPLWEKAECEHVHVCEELLS